MTRSVQRVTVGEDVTRGSQSGDGRTVKTDTTSGARGRNRTVSDAP